MSVSPASIMSSTPEKVKEFVSFWTPRVVIAGFVGYYSLGIAYAHGVMAAIDQIAIPIIQSFVGYAGLGATMPVFQWYAALGVQVISATVAALIYDLFERLIKNCIQTFS